MCTEGAALFQAAAATPGRPLLTTRDGQGNTKTGWETKDKEAADELCEMKELPWADWSNSNGSLVIPRRQVFTLGWTHQVDCLGTETPHI